MSAAADRTYRAGIIGLGDMGMIQHARAYRNVERAELVAACDLDRERLAECGRRHGIAGLYTDYREMVEREALDVVSVCTCPHDTPGLVCDLAASGKLRAIQCEKPMAVTWGEARRMVEACAAAGVKFGVSHQRRFMKWHQKNRELLREGAIGALTQVSQALWGGYPDPWVMATHCTDLMIFYAGEPQWVLGQLDVITDRDTHRGVRYRPETLGVLIGFPDHVHGVLSFGQKQEGCPPPPDFVRLVGERGELHAALHSPSYLLSYETGERREVEAEGYGWDGWDAFTPMIADLLASIDEDREPLCNGREAALAHAIILAAYESAHRGGRVDLPLSVEEDPLAAMVAEGRAGLGAG
jgi:UDP-N-acetylglucosamine 3-dehydrogenase